MFNDPRNRDYARSKYAERKLTELITYSFSGKTPTSSVSDYWENGNVLWASPKDFSNNLVIKTTQDKITELAVSESKLRFAEVGSVLMVVRSGVLLHTLPVMVCGERMTVNQDIKVFSFTSEILPEFFVEYLKVYEKRILRLITKHSTTVQSVNTPELETFSIPLPPIEKQKELVAEMEQAREARRWKLAEAETLLLSLDDWLLGQLGIAPPPEDNRKVFGVKLNDINGRIDTQFYFPTFQKIQDAIGKVRHYQLGQLVSYSNEMWDKKTADANDFFRYIEISGVNRNTGEAKAESVLVAEAPSRARKLVREGDIIVSLTRPHHGSIANIDSTLNECIASTGFSVLRYFNKDLVLPDYLWAVLRTQLSLKQMLQRSSGGNYPAITEDELSKILVPVADLPIQEQIVFEVYKRKDLVFNLRAEAESLWQAAKDRFEAQLLAGE